MDIGKGEGVEPDCWNRADPALPHFRVLSLRRFQGDIDAWQAHVTREEGWREKKTGAVRVEIARNMSEERD